jgi:hypothetical protein
LLRIDAPELQRRRQPEEQAADETEGDGKAKPHRVDLGLEADREGAVIGHRPQRIGTPHGDDDAERGAEQ